MILRHNHFLLIISVFPGILEQITGIPKLIASITANDIPSDRLRLI